MDITASTNFTDFMLSGEVGKAEALAKTQLQLAPNDPDAHAALAHAFMAEQNFSSALKQASAAMTLAADDDVGFVFLRSRVHYAMRRFKEAAADAQVVLSRPSADYFADSAKLLNAASLIQAGQYQDGLDALSSVPDGLSIHAGSEVSASDFRRKASLRLSSRSIPRGR